MQINCSNKEQLLQIAMVMSDWWHIAWCCTFIAIVGHKRGSHHPISFLEKRIDNVPALRWYFVRIVLVPRHPHLAFHLSSKKLSTHPPHSSLPWMSVSICFIFKLLTHIDWHPLKSSTNRYPDLLSPSLRNFSHWGKTKPCQKLRQTPCDGKNKRIEITRIRSCCLVSRFN